MPDESKRLYYARENGFFRAWTELVIRYRFLFLGAILTLSVFFDYQVLTRLIIDNSNAAYLGEESKSFVSLHELYDLFGKDDLYHIIIEGNVFSLPYLEKLKKLHQELAAIDLELESLGQRTRDKPQGGILSYFLKSEPAVDANKGQTQEAKRADKEDELRGFDEDFAGFDDGEEWGEEAGGTVIKETLSLINMRKISWQNGALSVAGLLDEWPTHEDLPLLKKHVLSDRLLVGNFVGKAGKHSVIVLRTDFMSPADQGKVYSEILRITNKYKSDDFKLMVGGIPAIEPVLDEMLLSDFIRLTVASTLVMLIVMTFIFRHPLGVVGPLLVVLQADIWILGLMAISEVPMTMVTNVLPAFLACVGLGSSIHIQSVYRDSRNKGIANREAIVHAVATTGIPVFYANMTTAIGMFSFYMASLEGVSKMGIYGAVSVLSVMFLSLTFLPIVLSFNKKSLLGVSADATKNQRGDLLDRILLICNALSRVQILNGRPSHRRRYLTLASITLVILVAGLGASTLTVYHDPLTWIPPEQEIRKAIESIDKNIGGTGHISLLITAKSEKGIKDRDLLLSLEKLEKHIQSFSHPVYGNIIGNSVSLLDVVRETNQALNDGDKRFFKIPETQQKVVDVITLFENSAPGQLRRLATVDLMNTLMAIRVKWLDALSYKPMLKYIEKGIKTIIGEKATVKLTGSAITFDSVVGALLTDLLKSFGFAFVVVTIMMLMLLKSFKLGLISAVPNLIPVLVVGGYMGFTKIPIDAANLIIASIIIGIGVDDTIHFFHQFRIHYQLKGNVEQAIDHAYDHTGRALVITSIILVLGFYVFYAAEMAPLHRFGKLAVIAVAAALLKDIVFSPALLRTFYNSQTSETTPERSPS